jgi:hypothetical protein
MEAANTDEACLRRHPFLTLGQSPAMATSTMGAVLQLQTSAGRPPAFSLLWRRQFRYFIFNTTPTIYNLL